MNDRKPYTIYYRPSWLQEDRDGGWFFDDARGNTFGPWARPSTAEAEAGNHAASDAEWLEEHGVAA